MPALPQRPATPVADFRGYWGHFAGFSKMLRAPSRLALEKSRLARFFKAKNKFHSERNTEMTKKSADSMTTRGIRMPDEQWLLCTEKSRELGKESPSDFIREAIDFYLEWLDREPNQKFLTPALESVMRAMVRDSEERVCRLLFKNAVELHLLTRLIYHDFNYKPEEVQAVRKEAIRLVGETNGCLNLDYIDPA